MLVRDFLSRNAEVWPEREAYVSDTARLTWSEVAERSRRLAHTLQMLGVQPGDVVASMSWDSHETVEVFYACSLIGAVRTGINPRYGAHEVEHILSDSRARVLIVEGGTCEDVLEQARCDVVVQHCIGIGAHRQALDYEELLQAAEPAPHLPEIAATDAIAVSYTTGSTGAPKGVVWTQSGVVEACTRTWMQTGGRTDDVFLHCLPAAGVPILMAMFNVFYGSKAVLMSRFDPHTSLQLMAREQVTTVLWVPTMMLDILGRPDLDEFDLSSLRLVIYGSMPASPALVKRASERLGCEFQQWYGSTEGTGGWFTQLSHADHLAALEGRPELLQSCGRAFLHSGLSIRDSDGQSVEPGEVGEICIDSETLMSGYLNLPQETGKALRDGVLHTGDLGRLDDQGYLFLVDRKDFMVVTGGYNVYPVVVENALADHQLIREVCVFGIPHERWGEVLCAVIVPAQPLDAEGLDGLRAELVELCGTRLGKLFRPHVIEFAQQLPRGATGKLLKRAVRDEYRAKFAEPGLVSPHCQTSQGEHYVK